MPSLRPPRRPPVPSATSPPRPRREVRPAGPPSVQPNSTHASLSTHTDCGATASRTGGLAPRSSARASLWPPDTYCTQPFEISLDVDGAATCSPDWTRTSHGTAAASSRLRLGANRSPRLAGRSPVTLYGEGLTPSRVVWERQPRYSARRARAHPCESSNTDRPSVKPRLTPRFPFSSYRFTVRSVGAGAYRTSRPG